MAAGRQGGCYVNEFREAEMRTRVLKRERLRCFEGECGRDLDRKRNQACEVRGEKSSYGRRGGDRIRRHGGEGKNGFVTGKRGPEAGELPGERGSNDPDVLDSEIGIRDDSLGEAAAKTVVQEMKRKFSPFVWNKEDKQVSKLLKKKTDASCNSIPISSFQHLSHPSSVSSPIEVVCTPSDQSVISNYVPSPLGKETVPGQLEEEDCLHSRNVPACRWNEVNDSSGSESELTDEEGEFKKSKKVHSKINHKTKKLQSLELRDLSGGASQGAQSQPSGSGGGHCSTSVRGNKYQEVVLDGHDSVEVVEEDNSSGVSIHSVDRDSDTQSSNGSSNQVGPSPRGINMLEGCRNVVEFEKLNRINEGTYGVVFRAKDRSTGEIVALKKLKMEKETEGFPLTSLREINILLSLHHPSIIHVKEVVVGSRLDDIFMVMDYMEHDLKGVMETMKQPFSQSEVKCLMIQLLEGVKYLHDNWVLHRDLKTSNILLNNSGELKICDFGLARQYGSPLKPYTQLVVTLWYRAPELLLGAKKYSTAIDMWSLGCIMAEMLASEPLFTGRSEQDQIYKIYELLGMPNENGWPGCTKLPNYRAGSVKQPYNKLRERFPPTSFSGRPTLSVAGFDLLNKFLTYDPEKRITAEEALNHEWFCEVPLPKSKEFMPTFPAQHAKKGNYGKL